MEITAALRAIEALDGGGPIHVVSDSTYVVNCFRDGWWRAWIDRGWKNSNRKPVANRDLWEPLIDLVRGLDDITFGWVKGHSGDPMNDFADELAVEAAQTQRGRAGELTRD
jgi:ribonuclease HI